MKILVTGGAGFIGSALAKRLFDDGHKVTIIDNFNDYYDLQLKRDRIAHLVPLVPVYMLDITNADALSAVFEAEQFDAVAHLAAQAGVRYSLEHPEEYVRSNVQGTQTLLEVMRKNDVKRMVYASTSSAYGDTSKIPFNEKEPADRPVSVYAATKRAGELIAHTYAHLYGMDITCLRFFTVYGPWGRPDMALFKFTDAMLKGEPIDVYNNGLHRRDFTYIDDIVSGFVSALQKPLGYEIINLGNGNAVHLMRFIEVLENELGIVAKKNMLPMQEGDVFETYADITKARTLLGFEPKVDIEEGVKNFVAWYKAFYRKS
jgi:UDP-glucuronate 4-epimerase